MTLQRRVQPDCLGGGGLFEIEGRQLIRLVRFFQIDIPEIYRRVRLPLTERCRDVNGFAERFLDARAQPLQHPLVGNVFGEVREG